MKIRFTRNILVDAEHCETGTTRDVSVATASELIASGSAVPVRGEERENARAPQAAKESATISTKKNARSK